MVGLGLKMANRFVRLPIAFYLMAILIQSTTAIAVGHVIRVIILKGFFSHGFGLIRQLQGVVVSNGWRGRWGQRNVGVTDGIGVLLGVGVEEGVGVCVGIFVKVGVNGGRKSWRIALHQEPSIADIFFPNKNLYFINPRNH